MNHYINFVISYSHHILLATAMGILFPPVFFSSTTQGHRKKVKPLMILEHANYPSFSFDGSRIAVLPEGGVEAVYEVNTKKKIGSFSEKLLQSGVISADGKRVRVFGDRLHTLYDVDSGKSLSQGDGSIMRDWQRLGGIWVTTGGGLLSPNITSDLNIAARFNQPSAYDYPKPDYPAILVGRLDDNSLVRELRADDDFVRGDIWEEEVLTPNGKYVAAERRNLAGPLRRKTVVWDVETGKVIFSVPFSSYGFSLSDDGSRIATRWPTNDLRPIQIWDVKTGKVVSTISQKVGGRDVKVNTMAISPDGKLLVTTRESDFYFWDTNTGKFITSQNQETASGDHAKVSVFSGNGRRIAVCTYGETITVWSVDEILKQAKFKN